MLAQVDKDLAGANAEIVKFQQDKQLRLNQIDIVVSLTLSQIYCQAAGVNTSADEDGLMDSSIRTGAPRRSLSSLRCVPSL